jgi:hypothetical protein
MILITSSCGGGGGDGGGVVPTPQIDDVRLYNTNNPDNPVETNSLNTSDHFAFGIDAHDNELDISILWVTGYPYNIQSPTYGTKRFELPSQTGVYMSYFIIEPNPLTSISRDYMFEFVLEDSKGNRSSIYRVYLADN